MSLVIKTARFLVFGAKTDRKARTTFNSIVARKASNVARSAFGGPPQDGPGFMDWLVDQAVLLWDAMMGKQPVQSPFPPDMPVKLFTLINEVLKNRGGIEKGSEKANYWVAVNRVSSTPFFWSFIIDYGPQGDPGKVEGFEMALEDALTKNGFDYNVRVQERPIRLEIDKPKAPLISLSDLWTEVSEQKIDARISVVGKASIKGKTETMFFQLTGEDFSAFIAASSGGGKTQLAMSMILSLAMTNSPTSLTMVLIDPKAVDFMPFNRLPHLAIPVVNEPTQAAEAIQFLCDEMDMRTARAARGDTSFFAHSILLYIDELADLLASLPKTQADSVAGNIQRLGQKGRGVGFILIGATQRVFDVPANAHTKLNSRFVGKTRSAGDSVAASGVAGSTTHKLPGRGSFELHCSDQTGVRIQAPFVAESDKPGYADALEPFFAAIDVRWADGMPGWMPPHKSEEKFPQILDEKIDTDRDYEQVEKMEIDAGMWQRMIDAYQGGKLTGNLVRNLHKEFTGKSCNGYKAQQMIDAFIGEQQQMLQIPGSD